MRLYVGNLPFSITPDQLRAHFASYGRVVSTTVATDRDTGRSRGFGFVEFADDGDGRRAINETNGIPLGGRTLKVNATDEKEERDGRFGGTRGYWRR